MPFISIVITSYNRAHTVVRAVESALTQTDRDIEIVVIDDGSTDRTDEVVGVIQDPRLRYIKLDINSGSSFARNRGILETRGEWVMVWDSDDILYPHAVATLRAVLTKHPECVVVSAPARMITNGTSINFPRHQSGFISLEQVLSKYIGNDEKIRLARRDVYLKAPYVSRNIDFIVVARLRAQGPWFHIDEFLGDVMLDNPDSLTRKRKKFDRKKSADRAPHLDAFMKDFGQLLKTTSSRRYGELAYGAALACACAGMNKKARGYALEAIKVTPLLWRSYVALLFSIFLPRRRN